MTKPKRQRTLYPMLHDKTTGARMWPALKVERKGVTVSKALVITERDVGRAEMEAAWERMTERAARLGFILRDRWFGGSG